MQGFAEVLASNVSVVAIQPVVTWKGGRGVIITDATTYPTTCQLQIQGPGGSFINVGANITANAMTAFDLPAGQYRLQLAGGVAAALYASLVRVPY